MNIPRPTRSVDFINFESSYLKNIYYVVKNILVIMC